MAAGEYVLDAIASDGTLTAVSEPRRDAAAGARRGRRADRRFTSPPPARASAAADAGRDRRRRPRRSPPCASWPASGRSAPTPPRPYDCAYRADRRRRRAHDADRGGHRQRRPDRRRGAHGQRRPLHPALAERDDDAEPRPPPSVPLHHARRAAPAGRAHARPGVRERRGRHPGQGAAQDDLHPPREAQLAPARTAPA